MQQMIDAGLGLPDCGLVMISRQTVRAEGSRVEDVEVLLAPQTPRANQLLMQVSGPLLARELRPRCWEAGSYAVDGLLSARTLVLIADNAQDHHRELDELCTRVQRGFFTLWSPRPLAQLRFCVFSTGAFGNGSVNCAASNGTVQRTDWSRRLQATLNYYGARELLPRSHSELPVGRAVRQWISALVGALDCDSRASSAAAQSGTFRAHFEQAQEHTTRRRIDAPR